MKAREANSRSVILFRELLEKFLNPELKPKRYERAQTPRHIIFSTELSLSFNKNSHTRFLQTQFIHQTFECHLSPRLVFTSEMQAFRRSSISPTLSSSMIKERTPLEVGARGTIKDPASYFGRTR